jgi:hypothetical protein
MVDGVEQTNDYSLRGSSNVFVLLLLKDVLGLPVACWLTLLAGGALGSILAATTTVS